MNRIVCKQAICELKCLLYKDIENMYTLVQMATSVPETQKSLGSE